MPIIHHVDPQRGDALLLVGTMKGAFVLRSTGTREKWDVGGPYFPGHAVYAMAYDRRAGRRRIWAGPNSIPGALRELAGGRSEVRLEGRARSVGEALALLWAECPGIRDRVVTELGDVRPHINVFVDGENVRHSGGLDSPIGDGAEILLLPAISGGA